MKSTKTKVSVGNVCDCQIGSSQPTKEELNAIYNKALKQPLPVGKDKRTINRMMRSIIGSDDGSRTIGLYDWCMTSKLNKKNG